MSQKNKNLLPTNPCVVFIAVLVVWTQTWKHSQCPLIGAVTWDHHSIKVNQPSISTTTWMLPCTKHPWNVRQWKWSSWWGRDGDSGGEITLHGDKTISLLKGFKWRAQGGLAKVTREFTGKVINTIDRQSERQQHGGAPKRVQAPAPETNSKEESPKKGINPYSTNEACS